MPSMLLPLLLAMHYIQFGICISYSIYVIATVYGKRFAEENSKTYYFHGFIKIMQLSYNIKCIHIAEQKIRSYSLCGTWYVLQK